MTKAEALERYHKAGYHILPLGINSKTPSTQNGLYDAEPNCEYLANLPGNIAIRTGKCSGVVVLDVDKKDGGLLVSLSSF